jgi:hypothetical protein
VAWPSGALIVAAAAGFVRRQPVRWHGLGTLVAPLAALVVLFALRRSGIALAELLPMCIRERTERVVRRGKHRVLWARGRSLDEGAHAMQAASMAVLGVMYVFACLFPRVVPAAVAVALALMLVTGIWGFLAFWMHRYRLLGVVVLVLLVFVSGRTRDAPPTGVTSAELSCGGGFVSPLLDDRKVLEQWKASLAEARPPLVVVATSGGASRAAVWTISVLAQLERRIPRFMRHVRIITGASGGMVGAAHYVSALSPEGLSPSLDVVRGGAAADSLTPVARALLLPGSDRGEALDTAWENNTRGRLEQPFFALRQGEWEGWRPSLIFAPMMVEDGRRLIISNLELGRLATTASPLLRCSGGALCPDSISAVQLFACPGQGLDRLKLSTVARMNATFPWVTSAALLPSRPPRRVVDAGYYDNYGVDIASLWIRKNADWLEANTAGVLLVQIRDAQSEAKRWDVNTPDGSGYFHQWVSSLTTPLEGFLRAREASMSFRNDDEVSLLAASPKLQQFFATTLFELDGPAPLSWYLSDADVRAITSEPPAAPFELVESWWKARSPLTAK